MGVGSGSLKPNQGDEGKVPSASLGMDDETVPPGPELKVDETPSATSLLNPGDETPIEEAPPQVINEIEAVVQQDLPTIRHQLTPRGIKDAWIGFWRHFIRWMWELHIESLYVPVYRKEWGKYQRWNCEAPLKPEPTDDELLEKEVRRQQRLEKEQIKLNSSIGRYTPHDWTLCERITINVSGTIFVTQLRTLKNFPESLLGDDKKRSRFYNPLTKEYFFDRSAECFETILHYYQTNGRELNRPPQVPLPIFEDEFSYYEMSNTELDRLRTEEGYLKDTEDTKPQGLLQRKLCLLFEYPHSSFQSKIVGMLSVSVVIFSILICCLETMDGLKVPVDQEDLYDPMFLSETVCVIWFCFEITIRFIVSTSKISFIRDYMNTVDLLSIVPYFIQIAYDKGKYEQPVHDQDGDAIEEEVHEDFSLGFLRVIRLVRVLRVFKLSRHSKGLKILARTLQASVRELGLLAFFLAVGTILFSSGLYFAELQAEGGPTFSSIPEAYYFAVTTMTTVGYGEDEELPKTMFGRVVGSLCALSGVMTLALPVPVIVANFNYFYHRESDAQYASIHRSQNHFVHICPWRPECELLRATHENNEQAEDAEKGQENDSNKNKPHPKISIFSNSRCPENFHTDQEDMVERLGRLKTPWFFIDENEWRTTTDTTKSKTVPVSKASQPHSTIDKRISAGSTGSKASKYHGYPRPSLR